MAAPEHRKLRMLLETDPVARGLAPALASFYVGTSRPPLPRARNTARAVTGIDGSG
jgi:hypothetical protein